MFNVAEMKADERLRRELQADVEEECQKLGPVDSVKVCENHPQGVVLVRLKDRKDAQKCIELMNGRWFGFLPGAHVPVVHRIGSHDEVGFIGTDSSPSHMHSPFGWQLCRYAT